MTDTRGGWSWDVPGFEPPTAMPRAPPTTMVLRPSAWAPRAAAGAVPVADRLDQLADSVQVLVLLWSLDLVTVVLVVCLGLARFVRDRWHKLVLQLVRC